MDFRDGRRLTDFPLCQGVPAEAFERSREEVRVDFLCKQPEFPPMEFGLFLFVIGPQKAPVSSLNSGHL